VTILSHTIHTDSRTSAEHRTIEASFQDHTGKQHRRVWSGVPIATVPNVWCLAQYTVIAGVLAETEVQARLILTERGQNPDLVPPVHQTQSAFDRRLLGQLMALGSIDQLLAAIPFWLAVQTRGGANSNSRASYLGVIRAEYDLVNGRFSDLQGVAGGVQTVNAQRWTDVRGAWL
jgi:hypothetical protein